jgi:hypothetical protein
MDKNRSLLNQDIARIRRDVRKTSREMQALVDADLDCTGSARVLMHLHDLRLYLEKQERRNEMAGYPADRDIRALLQP